jgi:hypothetical protein
LARRHVIVRSRTSLHLRRQPGLDRLMEVLL